jgi:hypothetical protein
LAPSQGIEKKEINADCTGLLGLCLKKESIAKASITKVSFAQGLKLPKRRALKIRQS